MLNQFLNQNQKTKVTAPLPKEEKKKAAAATTNKSTPVRSKGKKG